MSAALAYHFDQEESFDAANDNAPPACGTIIKMSTASRRGLDSHNVAARAAAPFSLSFIPRMNDLNARAMALRTKTRTAQPLEAYAQNGSYHRSGALESLDFGNGTSFTQTLNARLQPYTLKVSNGASLLQDMQYNYDKNGRVQYQTNHLNTEDTRYYQYDSVGRLKQANSATWGQAEYSYDALGNLRKKYFSGWNGAGPRTVTNNYNSRNRIVSSIDTSNIAYGFGYDTRGNVTVTGLLNFTYDMSDQPVAMSDRAPNTGTQIDAIYLYDGNMKRVKSVVNGKTIYNVYDAAGRLVHVDDVGGGETDYLHGMGQTLARIKDGEFTYLHPDHLGSPQVGTNESGAVAFNEYYTPFGEALVNAAANDNQSGFTGHIKDKSTGLNYMQARYYDPNVGRFLSIDAMDFMGSGGNPQYFNRYAYTFNDPVNNLDPDGNVVETVWDAANIALGAASFASNIKQGNFGSAALDAVGVVVDSAAAAVPFVPGGAGAAIKTGRAAKGAIKTKTVGKGCCFVAGTLVETKDGLRPIEKIEVGDFVLSRNPETGETTYKAVTNFIPKHERVIWEVSLSGQSQSSEFFETTDEHPWWVLDENGNGSWKRTDELIAGMIVTTADNQTMVITKIVQTDRIDATYNLTVADFETYFVGENKVLVHNCDVKTKDTNFGVMTSGSDADLKGAVNTARVDKALGDSTKANCASCKLEGSIKAREADLADSRARGQKVGSTRDTNHVDRINLEKRELESLK